MVDNALLQSVAGDVREIRKSLEDLQVSVEHRLTKVETRASIFGALSGAIMGIVSGLVHPGK